MQNDTLPSIPRTCVSPQGGFIYGLHQPAYWVANMRPSDRLDILGRDQESRPVLNQVNFPVDDVSATDAQGVYEIPNALPFRGTTYIGKQWADRTAAAPSAIAIHSSPKASFSKALTRILDGIPDRPEELIQDMLHDLPPAIQLALAAASNDPADLVALAQASCDLIRDPQNGDLLGLAYERNARGELKPKIHHEALFELVANHPSLPDHYKKTMMLKPGIQGHNEIVGEWQSSASHIYEYLRSNSYIAGGHYAANMADDAVRYNAGRLNADDIRGLRHLYYQRTYIRLAQELGLELPARRRALSPSELDNLRCGINQQCHAGRRLAYTATLWGWNYGFDYAPSGYRLHASHQQIHQQYALIPDHVPRITGQAETLASYACGDMVAEFARHFRQCHGKGFFDCYLQAIAANQRMDGRKEGSRDLTVFADERIILFVPKAQTSQWELQLMAVPKVGHILEADEAMRNSLDQAMLLAMRILRNMGAEMVTVIEYSKRFHSTDDDQRLLYAFLPRLPESPGTFSEAQQRWINGHYPEDFAAACRLKAAHAGDDFCSNAAGI